MRRVCLPVLLALLNGTPKRPASSWVDAARKARSGPRSPQDLFDRISGFSGWELHPVHPVILSKDRWGRLKRGQVRAVKRGSCRTQADDTEVVPPALVTRGFRGSGGSGSVPTGFCRGFCKRLFRISNRGISKERQSDQGSNFDIRYS
jgi:hypothetical protein